ncbi:MAG: hypothetical protein JW862_00965 [Anaerolineales bacterium]|nr:hypothetical protein [Anaerolineales bacterium]
MSYLVVLVLNNLDECNTVLHAWEATGAGGITILESTGLGRVRRAGYRDDLPLMPSLREIFRSEETHHRTLFSVVKDLESAHALVDATQEAIGDLDEPNTGVLFITPVVEVHGLNKRKNHTP